ncbi:MAG: dockerin type I domain-containing protein, partial [Ruminococcus sp.]|nr:dockerin type I domain-containing protein [Ruminococcus sp.]
FHVVENGYEALEFDAVLKTGKLIVKNSQSSSSDSYVDEKFIVTPEDKEVNAGETVTVGIYAENGSNRKAGQFVAQVIDANLPIDGATATMTSLRCTAVATKPEYKAINGTWYCDTLDSGEPQEIDASKPVAKFDITVPADAKAGTYEWKLDRFHVVENGYEALEFDAVLKSGKLIVKGGGDGFMLGDVNFDGKVDAKDASLILVAYSKASTGGEYGFTENQEKAAEVNGDGKIDAKDASAILAYYAMVSTATGDVPSLSEYLKNK